MYYFSTKICINNEEGLDYLISLEFNDINIRILKMSEKAAMKSNIIKSKEEVKGRKAFFVKFNVSVFKKQLFKV